LPFAHRRYSPHSGKQVEIYQAVDQTPHAVEVIVNFTEDDERRVAAILKDLKMEDLENVVVIDARADNKPSASKA
jgi:K+/H+ antiporter YhaU regulatory subunit KhtT